MSDLALSVGSTHLDELVEQLQKDNYALKERLQISQRVEIISEEDQVGDDDKKKIVHADGNLDEGEFNNAGNLFSIDLKKNDICRLSNLKHLRICLGGFHRACFRDEDINEIKFTDREDDTENSKSIHVGGGNDGLFWLSFTIHNWPKEYHEEVVADEQRYLNGDMGESLLQYITMRLPVFIPDAYVTFHTFSLDEGDNRGAIDNLPESLLSTLEGELDVENMRLKLVSSIIQLFDVRYGDSELWNSVHTNRPLMVNHVQVILEQFYGIRVMDSSSMQTVSCVIEMYWECRSMTNWSDEPDWEKDFFRRVLTDTQGAERAAEAAQAYSFTQIENGIAQPLSTGPDMVNDGDTDDDNSDYDEDDSDENCHDSNDD